MEWKLLESRQNPGVKLAASLTDKKERESKNLFLAEGITLLFDFAREGIFPKQVFLSKESETFKGQIEELLSGKNCVCCLVLPHVFEKITTEKGSQGIVSLYSLSDFETRRTNPKKVIALENVQDPGNVGTVIRTAAAFGFDLVCLVSGADPFSPKTVRATMGALCRIPVQRFSDSASLFAFLKENKIPSLAACLSSDAVPIEQASLSEPICIWIGNEGKGLTEEVKKNAEQKCIIPIGNTESLNAAVAASVFLWEVKRRNS